MTYKGWNAKKSNKPTNIYNSLQKEWLFNFDFLHNYFTFDEFFTQTLADGLLLEYEWQEISSDFQDSSQYWN